MGSREATWTEFGWQDVCLNNISNEQKAGLGRGRSEITMTNLSQHRECYRMNIAPQSTLHWAEMARSLYHSASLSANESCPRKSVISSEAVLCSWGRHDKTDRGAVCPS
jgi:hypothetical protein